jgi:hypothetical protein
MTMRTKLKAISSKPKVSVTVAVGRIELIADNLADSAMLTALSRGLIGIDAALLERIASAAKEVAREWFDSKQSFEMKAPRRKAKE